jgi:uncharacterized protein YgiM (DUF1202 family)
MALYFIYLSLCTITTSGNTSIAKQNERVRETRKIAKVAERMKEHKTKFKVRATNLNDWYMMSIMFMSEPILDRI